MPLLTSSSSEIYYEIHGDSGPAIVFCHGAGSNAATWWQQIPQFSEHFRCIIYDHRGFGRSAAPSASLTPQQLVDDVIAILEAERLKEISLVCQSLGGYTGLRIVLRYPESVRAFVCCDSPLGVNHPDLLLNLAQRMNHTDTQRVEERALAAAFVEQNENLVFLYNQINAFNPPVFGGSDPLKWRNAIATLFAREHLIELNELAAIACPTLFVVGEQDPLVTPKIFREIAQSVPASRFLEISGAGHSPYFEKPNAFNPEVLGFLKSSWGI